MAKQKDKYKTKPCTRSRMYYYKLAKGGKKRTSHEKKQDLAKVRRKRRYVKRYRLPECKTKEKHYAGKDRWKMVKKEDDNEEDDDNVDQEKAFKENNIELMKHLNNLRLDTICQFNLVIIHFLKTSLVVIKEVIEGIRLLYKWTKRLNKFVRTELDHLVKYNKKYIKNAVYIFAGGMIVYGVFYLLFALLNAIFAGRDIPQNSILFPSSFKEDEYEYPVIGPNG
ncbi:hypothetical protein SNEBB_006287 [Seison nebaliae]|nr:hypothetical protein SNEBB_006287 [Seison nebaliae]